VSRSRSGVPRASASHDASAPAAVPLRTRKKAAQQRILLDAAAELFRRRGYEATRMEDVAAHAEVSTKTVYNYFPTKQGLIVGLLNRDRDRLRIDYERVLNAPPTDPAEGLAALIRADVGDVETDADKRLWRELLAVATRGHRRALDDFESNRRDFTSYIERLLKDYVDKGQLASTLAIDVAVDMVYAVNAFDFREYCAAKRMKPSDVLAQARRQMRLLVEDWRPRRDERRKPPPRRKA
jgi:AcrR family transcriptional regulator